MAPNPRQAPHPQGFQSHHGPRAPLLIIGVVALSLTTFLLAGGTLLTALPAAAAAPDDAALNRGFKNLVHPFVTTYCVSCHGGDDPEAGLDLSEFSTVGSVVSGLDDWDLVLEKLEGAEMPPQKAKKHPPPELERQIAQWIESLRRNQARKTAGDPGLVAARRLSNAEYDYTIHDLTGVDLRPAREFPVDPANQAGFDNSGESLTMSPALLRKHLDAARLVADHLVLKTDGFEFAPHPVVTDTDRDKYYVLKIVDFYQHQPTDLADYFAAAWGYRHRAALGRRFASLADIAAQNRVSGKYLATIYATLMDTRDDAGPLARLRAQWNAMPKPSKESAPSVRAAAQRMRDYVVSVRERLVPVVPNLSAPPIHEGSQTLVLWKDRQMAANRRRFDPGALHVEGSAASDTSASSPVPVTPAVLPPSTVFTHLAATPPAPASATTLATPAPRGPSVESAALDLPPTASALPTTAAPGPATSSPAPAAVNTSPTPTGNAPADTLAAAAQALKDTIRNGGQFIPPAIVTAGSSATAQMAASEHRDDDPDLLIPADPLQRARHLAAFARFASVFPDAFYITERARVYLDAASEQKLSGRLLSAGLHSMTGYFRDDEPLYDLVLGPDEQRELDRLWREFYFSASIPQRMHTSFVWWERTDSTFMRDPEFAPFRPEDRSVTDQDKIGKLASLYLAKAVANNASPTVQQAIAEHFQRVAADIAQVETERAAAEPRQLQALLNFAARAYRRPLSQTERDGLLNFYRQSRESNGLGHEDAMRDSVAAILMSPNFSYRLDLLESARMGLAGRGRPAAVRTGQASPETLGSGHQGRLPEFPEPTAVIGAGYWGTDKVMSAYAVPAPSATPSSGAPATPLPGSGVTAAATHTSAMSASAVTDLSAPKGKISVLPLSDYALASRLSYFLWSSMPDAELLEHAAAGDLHRPAVLEAQARRMLADPRLANFAAEFMGHWLEFRRFEEHNAVDRGRFPNFDNALREAMYQEPLHFFMELIRHDAPVQDLLYGDYTFVNAPLAKLYGIPDSVVPGGFSETTWTRIDHAGAYGRGGLLPMAVFLTANSPGLRTSPVKRGHWFVSDLLGQRIPAPPANVPSLPADEKTLGDMTLRQSLEAHRHNAQCAGCHARFDTFGLAMEGFGAIGELRSVDFGGHPIDARADFPGGTSGTGMAGLRDYIRAHREAAFIDNLAAKLLAYGLGRTLLLSDQLLLDDMKARLAAAHYRFGALVEALVVSPQFRNRRIQLKAGPLAADNRP